MTESGPSQPPGPSSGKARATGTDRPKLAALSIPTVLCAALVLTSSFDLMPGVAPYNGKRLIQVLVFMFLIWMTFGTPLLRAEFRNQVRRIPLVVHFAFGAASLLAMVSGLRFSHPGYSLAEVGILVTLLIAALCVAASRRLLGRLFDRISLLFIALLGVAIAVQECMGLLAHWEMGKEFSFDQMLIQFAHPRFYNQLQTWTIPLLAGIPLLFARSRSMVTAAMILIALQWSIVLMSGGRGTTVSLGLSLALFAVATHRSAGRWLGIQVAGFLLGCVLFGGITMSHTSMAPEGGEFLEQSIQRPMTHTSGRFHMWSIALNQATSHPMLGIGPGRYACESTPTSPAHPHNFVLQVLAEWGIPATILILIGGGWLAGRLLLASIRGTNPEQPDEQILLILLASSILAAAIHACLSGILMTPASQLIGCLIIGWAIGVTGEKADAELPHSQAGARALGFLGIVISSMLVAFTAFELRNMDLRLSAMTAAVPDTPRYWQAGRICNYSYDLPVNR